MRMPDDSQRLAIMGKTGSGKTQAAKWHLSERNFDQMPWIIYDFKQDQLVNSIPGLRELDLDTLPVDPGVYIVHPLPSDQDAVEAHLWGVWDKGRIGVYVDEGYMMGRDNPGFNALLTQGRSKTIPMIICSQRPAWITRFLFSESDFYQVFYLNDRRDQKTVGEFIKPDLLEDRLPEFHSYYYDVGDDALTVLKPVPENSVLDETFRARLQPIVEEDLAVRKFRFV